jgi:hypothetical protein
MNTNIYNREKYTKIIIGLQNDEDRYNCILRLTMDDRHLNLCRSVYDETYLRAAVNNSDYIIIHRHKDDIKNIVGFALLRHTKHKMEILLLCTIPNTENYGNMVAYSVYNFAVSKKCKGIYVAPRTPELRKTFIKHGFKHYLGLENINEMLEKTIIVTKYTKINRTLKTKYTNVLRRQTLRSKNRVL